ncbi:hypothetical protein BGX31_001158 [Mortierella sp. GBA43]|nr:hypothetical protein BGX31_001158 [Mortierella sp. GBA43]
MNKEYDNMGNKMINKYLVVRELGRGVHGKVKLCRDTITNEFCAIKIVDKTTRRRLGRSQLSNEQKIRREIAIMKKCDHPNVVKLIEVIDDPTAKKIYLVLEYMEGGEVRWKDTEDKPILSLQEARSIFRDVVLGLEYLHMQGIYHRDIKPANLLLSAEGGVKISDFGVSHFSEKNALERDLENSPDVTKGFTTPPPPPPIHPLASPVASAFPTKNLPSPNQHPEFTSPYQQRKMSITSQHHCEDLELAKTAGSPAFFAPELCYSSDFPVTLSPIQPSASQATFSLSSSIIRPDPSASTGMLPATTGRPPITKAIDIWALGVTLYCFVYGRCPFIADTEFELFNIIPRKQPVFPDHVPGRGYVNPEIKDLLSRLLEKDVHKRITLKEVKEHPWVTEDLADPMRWRIETDPANYQRVHVTEEEVKGAVTLMDKIKNRIRKLSVSLSNFTNRRRSKSISSTYTPDSPTEHGPIPIIRSPNAAADLWTSSQAAVSPMSLPERFHNSHMYNGAPANICPGRLERPNSICSTTSSIDEVNEGDEHSHSGSGSSAQNNTSYVGRRRLFNPAGQQHQPPYPQHPLQQYPSTTTPYQQQQHQHQHHPQGRYPQRPPSYVEFPAALTNNALATRRTYSDDQLDQALSHRMQTAFYSTSASGRSGSISHSALSKSWVYSPSDQSPLSPALHDVDGGGILQDDPDDRTPTQFTERNIPEDHGSTHHLNDL